MPGRSGTWPRPYLSKAVVKGKTAGIGIYTTREKLSAQEQQAWQSHAHDREIITTLSLVFELPE